MSTIDREWLDGLKVGDLVVRSGGYTMADLTLHRVSSASEKFVKLGSERFRREDGRLAGNRGSYFMVEIERPTNEALQTIKLRRLASKLESTKWRSLPLETLESIVALLPEKE